MIMRMYLVLLVSGVLLCCGHAHAAGEISLEAASIQPAQRIVCLGDSITDGQTYPLLVQQSLAAAGKPAPMMINAGVGGDGVVGMAARLDRDVFSFQPDLVIVSAGINDLKMSAAEYERKLTELLEPILARRVKVLLLTLTTLGPERAEMRPHQAEFNTVLRKLAKDRNLMLGDVAQVMGAADGTGACLNEADGTHLKFEGYCLMTRGVLDGLGYTDVPVAKEAKPSVLPGIISEWRVRPAKQQTPLTEREVKQLTVDETWKSLRLPQTEPLANWFMDQERQRGVAVGLDTILGKAKEYQAIAVVRSDRERNVFLNTGALVKRIWLNGNPLAMSVSGVGWHPGGNRIPVRLAAGENMVVIESGGAFFVSITDDRMW